MKRMTPAQNPDAYVASLSGWQRACVENLRAAVRSATDIEETVKWGHLVYRSNGPVLLIRAESERILFGFWRGQRLRGTTIAGASLTINSERYGFKLSNVGRRTAQQQKI